MHDITIEIYFDDEKELWVGELVEHKDTGDMIVAISESINWITVAEEMSHQLLNRWSK